MTIVNSSQFYRGKKVEAWLDDYFRQLGWTIRPTTQHEERTLCLGDRRFERGSEMYLVEYKSGLQTHATGNIFLETVSVDTANKPGWVYTCKADYIFYAALLNRKILIFKPQRLRQEIDRLKLRFKEVATSKGQNATYNTHGVIVPLPYAEQQLAERVIPL